MSSPCRRSQSLLVNWSREGCNQELSDEVRRHVDTCDQCQEMLNEVLAPRQLLVELPVRRMNEERLGEIRFALMAAARQSGPPADRVKSPVGKRRFAWLAAATIAVLTGVLLVAFPFGGNPRRSRATITLERNAEGLLAGSVQDQVYVLVEGEAEFDIAKLDDRDRFRVFAHADVIEVRGTRFAAQVQDGGLADVSVTEGRVIVHLADGNQLDLRGGDRWRRGLPTEAIVPHEQDTKSEAVAFAAPEESAKHLPNALAPRPKPGGPGAIASRGTASSAALARPASAGPSTNTDALFRRAWQLYHQGEPAQAAALFDEMARDPNLDEARRVDVLFWSAKAHARVGDTRIAEDRARTVIESQPNAWHAAESALMLGESHLRAGRHDEARRALLRAAASPRASVRSRALELLGTIPAGGVRQPTGAPK